MKNPQKKTRKTSGQALQPLSPEAQAHLEAQLAQVKEALAAGRDPEVLQELVSPKPEDFAWDLHLITSLATLRDAAIPSLLAALFGGETDKERRKAVKKALHVLKTKGVPVPEDVLPRKEARPLTAAAPPTLLAYASPIFGSGERYLVLEGPKEILGGNFLVARMSDTAGFQEYHLLSLKRKHRIEFWQHFRDQGLGDFPSVPTAYVVRLLEEAYALNPSSDGGQQYSPLRSRIWQHWGRPEEAPETEILLPSLSDPERNLYLERSRDLVQHELFRSWLPSMEEISPWVKKVHELQDSPLILAEHQQQARFEQVLEEAALALYPLENRELWRRRLMEMAYFLTLKGLTEEARAAQAAAEDLAPGAASPLRGENSFLLGLVRFAMSLALEYLRQTEPAKPDSGLVAPPSTEPLIIRR